MHKAQFMEFKASPASSNQFINYGPCFRETEIPPGLNTISSCQVPQGYKCQPWQPFPIHIVIPLSAQPDFLSTAFSFLLPFQSPLAAQFQERKWYVAYNRNNVKLFKLCVWQQSTHTHRHSVHAGLGKMIAWRGAASQQRPVRAGPLAELRGFYLLSQWVGSPHFQ